MTGVAGAGFGHDLWATFEFTARHAGATKILIKKAPDEDE